MTSTRCTLPPSAKIATPAGAPSMSTSPCSSSPTSGDVSFPSPSEDVAREDNRGHKIAATSADLDNSSTGVGATKAATSTSTTSTPERLYFSGHLWERALAEKLAQDLGSLRFQKSPKTSAFAEIADTLCNHTPNHMCVRLLGRTQKERDASRIKLLQSLSAEIAQGKYVAVTNKEELVLRSRAGLKSLSSASCRGGTKMMNEELAKLVPEKAFDYMVWLEPVQERVVGEDQKEDQGEIKHIVYCGAKAAYSVLKGSDLFTPGVMSVDSHTRSMCGTPYPLCVGDLVEVRIAPKGFTKCLGQPPAPLQNENDHPAHPPGKMAQRNVALGRWAMPGERVALAQKTNGTAVVTEKVLSGGRYVRGLPSMGGSETTIASSGFSMHFPSIMAVLALASEVLGKEEDHQRAEQGGAQAQLKVLDMCAAPGGKTFFLADVLPKTARIVALDKSVGKVARMAAKAQEIAKTRGALLVPLDEDAAAVGDGGGGRSSQSDREEQNRRRGESETQGPSRVRDDDQDLDHDASTRMNIECYRACSTNICKIDSACSRSATSVLDLHANPTFPTTATATTTKQSFAYHKQIPFSPALCSAFWTVVFSQPELLTSRAKNATKKFRKAVKAKALEKLLGDVGGVVYDESEMVTRESIEQLSRMKDRAELAGKAKLHSGVQDHRPPGDLAASGACTSTEEENWQTFVDAYCDYHRARSTGVGGDRGQKQNQNHQDQPRALLGPPPYLPNSFDLILCDAPCSAMGQKPLDMDPEVFTLEKITQAAVYQRKILAQAVLLLDFGGSLLYSTCTISKEENEDNVRWLLEKFGGKEEFGGWELEEGGNGNGDGNLRPGRKWRMELVDLRETFSVVDPPAPDREAEGKISGPRRLDDPRLYGIEDAERRGAGCSSNKANSRYFSSGKVFRFDPRHVDLGFFVAKFKKTLCTDTEKP